MELPYIFSGLLVGVIVGLTGVGGGSLMTPLLIMLFGFAPATAVGTDLLYASITKGAGTLVHSMRGNVEWRIVLLLACGSLPAAVTTILLLKYLAVDSARFSAVITHTLGFALILTAIAIVYRQRLLQLAQRWKPAQKAQVQRWRLVVTVAGGAVLGVLVTISSVGAGALGTMALFLLYPRLPAVKIVGTDIVHAVPLTAIAGLGHAALGTVNYVLLGSLLLGSIPGIWLGSYGASMISEHKLRPLLATILVVLGARFVL